jgi:DNA-binding NtrC family response regulator
MPSPRILLVDDDDDLRRSLATVLSRRGARVREAASGDEALWMIAHEGRFELVITDVIMPAPLGTQLAAMARTAGTEVPILVITAYPDPEIAETVDKIDNATMLRKPFSTTVFLRSVSELLGGHWPPLPAP